VFEAAWVLLDGALSLNESFDEEVGAKQDQGNPGSLLGAFAPMFADLSSNGQANLRSKERLQGDGRDDDGNRQVSQTDRKSKWPARPG
jgi:hypothetical protein